MTRLVITSKDAERIARSFSDLIGPKGLDAIRRKAVNQVGSRLRKETRSLAGIVFGTSAAALSVQGKAASPRQSIAKSHARAAVYRLRSTRLAVRRSGSGRSGARALSLSCYGPGRCPSAQWAGCLSTLPERSREKAIPSCTSSAARPKRICPMLSRRQSKHTWQR